MSTAALGAFDINKLNMTTRAKPVLKWVGGKGQLLPELLARVPEKFERYFEPFCGGAALFFALQPDEAYLRDTNAELIGLYEVLRSDVEALITALRLPLFSNDPVSFYSMRALTIDEPVMAAARTIYLNRTCFNGLYRVNAKGKFNSPFGKYKNPTICNEENLRAAAEALQGAFPTCGDFRGIEHVAKEGDFVYLDPPYIPLTKTSSFTAYTPGKFGLPEHTALRDMTMRMKARGVSVLISNSGSPVTEELYGNGVFTLEAVQARRNVNSKGAGRGAIKEYLIR
jgi:DNA adenine methylase